MVGGGSVGNSGGVGDGNLLSLSAQDLSGGIQHQQRPLGDHHGQWGVDQGLHHQLQQQLQQQQQQLQQQQLNMMLGQQSLAPLVGQQISQLSASMLPVGSQHQSPPTLNMMLSGGANIAAMFQNPNGIPAGQVQSPPSSQGGGQSYLLLGTAQPPAQRHGDQQGLPTAISPNSTPGIQMPAPPATPPMMGVEVQDRRFVNRMIQPGLEKFGMEGGMEEQQQAYAWKGMQGGILAEMFPAVDRHPHFGDPRIPNGPGQGMNPAAMAQFQAQENLVRMQHMQQKQQHMQLQGHPQMFQDMRSFPHLMPAQSPPASNLSQFPQQHQQHTQQYQLPQHGHGGPPGPRPRPVGGDDSSPGFTPEVPVPIDNESKPKDDLIIGSWNEEVEKESIALPPTVQHPPPGPPPIIHNLSQPPPNQPSVRAPNFEVFGGNFHNTTKSNWNHTNDDNYKDENSYRGRAVNFQRGRGRGRDVSRQYEDSELLRGGYRGRGGSRGIRGGRIVDQERADGKNAAIEETKALMLKMRLEDKELIEKHKKKKGILDEVKEVVKEPSEAQPGAYKPKERRGRGVDDRRDPGGRVARSGRGNGRGLHQNNINNVPAPLFNLSHGAPSDFRTPPFPGLEGFLPPQGINHFPPGFPPHLGPGFPPGMFPGGLRGRGFSRGRGFPAGFPPRGFPPAIVGRGARPRGVFQGRGKERGRSGGGGSSVPPDEHTHEAENEAEDENPLLNAISKSGKDSDVVVDDSNATQTKNLFSEQGRPMGQLALLADTDLRGRLTDQLVRGCAECMVCLERVRQHQATWDCHNCYQIFHLSCIKKWAKTARTDTGGWRCPGCQTVADKIPVEYRCFCRKSINPEWRRNEGLVPHSCGEVCGRKRSEPCLHLCVDICHAGPCPQCTATVLASCSCGKKTTRLKCGVEFTCENICEHQLSCGIHKCEHPCHQQDCCQCNKQVHQSCYCGKSFQDVLCTEETAGVTNYSCNQVCDKLKDCGRHSCTDLCHSGECSKCNLTIDCVTTCPCGKTPLEKLYEGDGIEERKSCLDPVPTCSMTCNSKLSCGPQSNTHKCVVLCHIGQCPVCPGTTLVRCRCGHMDRELHCSQLTGRPDDARCERRCQKKRSCGRHKCGQFCCIDMDHICTMICGRVLACGIHRCEDLCHSGLCKTCPRVGFNELTCTCGITILYPPIQCGTKPPECKEVCTLKHDCLHPVTHNCHSEEKCPPCTQLVTKKCFGGHEERKNVACLVEGISCGKQCAKQLHCANHTCVRICHPGSCLDENSCSQPCKILRSCGHPCNQTCHSGDCPDSICSTQVRVSCECGHRFASVQCCENQYSRVTTAMLASRMQDMQAGNTVNLNELTRKDKKLECSEECFKLERNKRIALALQIRNPDISSKITPKYSDFLKSYVKKDAKLCSDIHDELTKLVQLAKESKQKTRLKSFDCMNREKRQFVHEYVEHFGCTSESFDAEPKRNVVATAYREKSWLPAISLLDYVHKLKKLTAPVPSASNAPPVTLTNLTKSNNSATSNQNNSKEKIDWFD
jgi:transcriptional repressor NF-X1